MKKTIALLTLVFSCTAQAEFNQLHLGTRLNLDHNITTVREAVNWLLRATDYRLTTAPPAPAEAEEIVSAPISPLTKIVDGVVTVEKALLLVGGGETRLIVDHQHKLISFEYLPNSEEENNANY